MRPRVKPALRRLDRDGRTLQFGVHPLRAVVLTDVEPASRKLIDSLDGTCTLDELMVKARRFAMDEKSVRDLVDLLRRRGVLDDASVRPEALTGLSTAERDRLGPDLDALSLTGAEEEADGGHGGLRRRRRAHIRVYGAGRVGAQVVAILAAAGVGHLCVVDPGTARDKDVVPGGLGWAEVGARRDEGAVAVAKRLAPGLIAWTGRTASRPGDGARRPDLVVLAPVTPLDGVLAAELVTQRIPHLLVTAFEGYGSVGPLVLPGHTACLRCLDLTRRDRDPSWPIVGALLGGFPAGEIACGTALSTLVAAYAAGHALALIDGKEPTVTNSTCDVMPDWRWRRRTWQPHSHCGCSRNESASPRMVA